jgi:septal ring factor EnvC (AmiA/AmiB activator)
MASEAASPPPSPSLSLSPPTSPEPELAQLRRKVEKLERELRSCKRQVQEIEKLLHHTERLYQSAESSNQELRTQVRAPPGPRRPRTVHAWRRRDAWSSSSLVPPPRL